MSIASEARPPWLTPERVLIAMSLLSLIPIWGARFPIMQDLSGHLETSYQFARLVMGDAAYTSVYRLNPQPWPNSLPIIFLAGMGELIGYLDAAKLLLSAYVFAWPLSIAFFLRAIGRSPWLAVLVLPTTFDLVWGLGFLNFILAKPLVFVVVGFAARYARDGRRLDAVLTAALLVVTFFLHSMLFLYAGLCSGLAVLCFAPDLARTARLWPLALGSLVAVPYALAAKRIGTDPAGWVWHSPKAAVISWWTYLGRLSDAGNGEEVGYRAMAIGFIVVLLLAVLRGRTVRWRATTFLWLVIMVTTAMYLWGPTRVPQVSIVVERLMIFDAVFFVCLLSTRLVPGKVEAVLAALFVAAFAWQTLDLARQYRRFSAEEMGDLEAVLDKIPQGQELATFFTTPLSRYGLNAAHWHWPKLYVVQRGGRTDDSFAYRPTTYVAIKPQAAKAGYMKTHRLTKDTLRAWDYLLVWGRSKQIDTALAGVGAEVGAAGQWHVYRILAPGEPGRMP